MLGFLLLFFTRGNFIVRWWKEPGWCDQAVSAVTAECGGRQEELTGVL